MRPSLPRVAASLVALAAVAAAAPQGGPPPSPVRVDPARLAEIRDERLVTGEVRAVQRSRVAAQEPGVVLEILVREGARVQKGDPLARLDTERLELALVELDARTAYTRALLDERQADHERTERDLEVLRELEQRNAVNPKELADAGTDVAASKARLEQVRQDLAVHEASRRLLQRRLADMQPRAPFGGTVVSLHTEAGQWLEVGGELLELVSDGQLEAWLDVPQAYFNALRASDDPVALAVDSSGQRFQAASWRAVPSIDPRGRTFRLIAQLPREGEASLAPGMSLTAEVPTGRLAQHLTVARDGVLRGEIGPYVYVARGGGEGAPATAQSVPIEVLFYTGERVAVRAPRLAEGDLVVVEGNERLYPTAPVQPIDAPAAREAATGTDGGESGR